MAKTSKWSEAEFEQAYSASQFQSPSGAANPYFGLGSKLIKRADQFGYDITDAAPATTLEGFQSGIMNMGAMTGKNQAKLNTQASSFVTAMMAQKQMELTAEAQKQYDEFQADGDYDKLITSINTLPPTMSGDVLKMLRNAVVTNARQDETARVRRVSASLGLRGAGASGGAGAMLAEMSAAEADQQISKDTMNLEMKKAELDRQDELQRLTMLQAAFGAQQGAEQSYLGLLSGINTGSISSVGRPFDTAASFYAALDAQNQAQAGMRNSNLYGTIGAFLGSAGDAAGAYAATQSGGKG
jgi:hypothetical protein